jgi:hypothetical protein
MALEVAAVRPTAIWEGLRELLPADPFRFVAPVLMPLLVEQHHPDRLTDALFKRSCASVG